MRRLAQAAYIVACVLLAAPANSQTLVQQFGIGTASCALWTDYKRGETEAWIKGYWTGLNAKNSTNHMVGHDTDSEGILAEVEVNCRASPSLHIIDAVTLAYNRLMAEGR